MLQEGVATAEDIDKALKLGLNHPWARSNSSTWSASTPPHILEYLHKSLGEKFRPAPPDAICESGRLGRKSGRGVFEYPEAAK